MNDQSIWTRVGPFAAAALLLIGGALKAPSPLSEGLVSAGLVVLGAWLAVEIAALIDKHYDDNHSEGDDS
jgi:hypothetical protein